MSERVAKGERLSKIKAGTLALVGCLALNTLAGTEANAEVPSARSTETLAAAANLGQSEKDKPNIVFILADDMDTSLLKYMPNTRREIFDKGADFENYFTNISLCCPARASILTGKYAHNTGVTSNAYPGGFYGFHTGDEKQNTFAVWLKERGYNTSLMGKYLNEYPYVDSQRSEGVNPRFIPEGWTDWMVPIKGQYAGDNYLLNLNGKLENRKSPKDHLSDFMARRAIAMIKRNNDNKGLFIEYSSYGPHNPQPASPIERSNKRLRKRVAGIKRPRTPEFNEDNVSDKPSNIKKLPPMSPRDIAIADREHRERILSVKTIDRHVGKIVRSLQKSEQLDNTYIIFSSDNGFHLGEHRMREGKNTPYDTDIHVPFGIRGPGIAAGTVVDEITGNIDIAPTIADIANARTSPGVDGESLLPLAQGQAVTDWREYFYVQRGKISRYERNSVTTEPGSRREYIGESAGKGYSAVVSKDTRYVEYLDGFREFYDISTDPYQNDNLLGGNLSEVSPRISQAAIRMQTALARLRNCSGQIECRVQD